jgi:ankyrin repeat protein
MRSLVLVLLFLLVARASAASLASEITKGDTTKVAKMLAHGTDANKPDHDGNLALDAAATRCNPRMVEILLSGGADAKRGTPLCRAIRASQPDSAERLKVVEILLAAGSDPNRGSPLLDAVMTRQDTIAARLLAAGAAPDSLAGRQNTALLEAIRQDNLPLVTMLLGNGATVECSTIDAQLQVTRPLGLAASLGRQDVVRLLLDRGANPNHGTCGISYEYQMANGVVSKDDLTLTAKGTLALAQNDEIRQLLRSRGARESVKVDLGAGTYSWASAMFVSGHRGSYESSGTLGTSKALSFTGELDYVFLALFNDLMRKHGVPDALIDFFGK